MKKFTGIAIVLVVLSLSSYLLTRLASDTTRNRAIVDEEEQAAVVPAAARSASTEPVVPFRVEDVDVEEETTRPTEPAKEERATDLRTRPPYKRWNMFPSAAEVVKTSYNSEQDELTQDELAELQTILDETNEELIALIMSDEEIMMEHVERSIDLGRYTYAQPGVAPKLTGDVYRVHLTDLPGDENRIVIAFRPGDSPELETLLNEQEIAKEIAHERLQKFFGRVQASKSAKEEG